MVTISWCVFNCSFCLDSVQDGYTALYAAAFNGHLKIVEILITANADVNIQNNVSPIDCVCELTDCVVECVCILTVTSVSEYRPVFLSSCSVLHDMLQPW